MKVLVIGGAGYVGSIIRPALEREHDCTHYDLRPLPALEGRPAAPTIVGDINDEELLKKTFAQARFDAIVHMAMGVSPARKCDDTVQAFAVNVCGTYQVLRLGLDAGVQRFVYASTLSVYDCGSRNRAMGKVCMDESVPADEWRPYGFSKRVAEFVLHAAAERYPDRTLTALRLMLPRNEQDWPVHRDARKPNPLPVLGPQDTTTLFLAALRLERPGCHIIQGIGRTDSLDWSAKKAQDVLGWTPQWA
jgi:nucleoside-diphosphate-sugar epimerase